jgi:hypothetical protein
VSDLLLVVFAYAALHGAGGKLTMQAGEALEKALLVRVGRAVLLGALALVLATLLVGLVVDVDVSGPAGTVAVLVAGAAVVALGAMAVAVARDRFWRAPEFPEPLPEPLRIKPIGPGGAHAAPSTPLWTVRRYAGRPRWVVGGVVVMVAGALGLAAIAVGLRNPLGVPLAWAGTILAWSGGLAGWLGEGIGVASLFTLLLVFEVFWRRDDEPRPTG